MNLQLLGNHPYIYLFWQFDNKNDIWDVLWCTAYSAAAYLCIILLHVTPTNLLHPIYCIYSSRLFKKFTYRYGGYCAFWYIKNEKFTGPLPKAARSLCQFSKFLFLSLFLHRHHLKVYLKPNLTVPILFLERERERVSQILGLQEKVCVCVFRRS